jgi:curved DNA-binding protein CbpA
VYQDQVKTKTSDRQTPLSLRLAHTHYGILGLPPSASPREIRRSYRELSKKYHPDTTLLPLDVAKDKFQEINEAYAILSNPERRSLYDLKIGYSRLNVIQAPLDLNSPNGTYDHKTSNSAYLDPSDRPLSSGEIFALFMLVLSFIGCLVLVFIIALIRGDQAW